MPEMRRCDREVTDLAEIQAIIEKSMILHLGLFDEEFPYVVLFIMAVNTMKKRINLSFKCMEQGKDINLIGLLKIQKYVFKLKVKWYLITTMKFHVNTVPSLRHLSVVEKQSSWINMMKSTRFRSINATSDWKKIWIHRENDHVSSCDKSRGNRLFSQS